MVVFVEHENIEDGIRASARSCPVAKAIHPLLKKGMVAEVGVHGITILDDMHHDNDGAQILWIGETPNKVKRFVKRFDKGLPVRPIAIEIGIPKDLLRKEA